MLSSTFFRFAAMVSRSRSAFSLAVTSWETTKMPQIAPAGVANGTIAVCPVVIRKGSLPQDGNELVLEVKFRPLFEN